MGYANPLKTLKVTSGYRTKLRPNHNATDYKAPKGTTLYAAIDGTVRTGTGHKKAGTWIEIDGDGVKVGYSHLSARSVKPGQKVKAGQVIGKSGATGRAFGAHLHFYVHLLGKHVNPHTWLADVTRKKPKTAKGKTTADWLTRAQIRTLQSGLRNVFPAYRWKVNVKRGSLIAVDGVDGPQTQAWVKAFQKAVGIKQDGIVGPVTQGRLARYGIKV